MTCCPQLECLKLNQILESEFKSDVKAEDIMLNAGRTPFCSGEDFLPERAKNLTPGEYLDHLNKKAGVYTVWEPVDKCSYCDKLKLKLIYAGKAGETTKAGALGRLKSHLKSKFSNHEEIHIVFFPCINRIAKYYEQAILDVYNTKFNEQENPGTDTMYIFIKNDTWDGTYADEQAYAFSKKNDQNHDVEEFCYEEDRARLAK